MRHVIRLIVALLTFGIGLTAATVWSALQPSAPAARRASSNDSVNVTISPITFYERHQNMQMVPRIGSNGEPIPSYSYNQIKDWNVDDRLHDGWIDVVCQLENHGSQPVDLMVVATGDLWQKAEGEEQLRNPSNFVGRSNIGQQVIHALAPGEKREVNFADFNVNALSGTFGGYPDLRHSALRVSVDVMTLDNMQTAWAGGQLWLTFGR